MSLNSKKNQHITTYSMEELSKELTDYCPVTHKLNIFSEGSKKAHNYLNFKLQVEIKAAPKLEIIVSRPKVNTFKSWMNGETI